MCIQNSWEADLTFLAVGFWGSGNWSLEHQVFAERCTLQVKLLYDCLFSLSASVGNITQWWLRLLTLLGSNITCPTNSQSNPLNRLMLACKWSKSQGLLNCRIATTNSQWNFERNLLWCFLGTCLLFLLQRMRVILFLRHVRMRKSCERLTCLTTSTHD